MTFRDRLCGIDPGHATFSTLQTLQVNLGNVCNLRCAHCHIDGSPEGATVMGEQVMEEVALFLAARPGLTLDLTGGCPELNPRFRRFVERTAGLCGRRIVRSNLTIMAEPGMEWLPSFCREQELVVTASLPCYLQENVDRQRGAGVYVASIEVLKRLNRLGYGTEFELNLVYNPGGNYLPGSQKELEESYRRELHLRHGIVFTNLFTITNAPIGRFRSYLEAKGKLDGYLALLAGRFNPAAAAGIMCRTLVSVDPHGTLYNCDFNQALRLPLRDDAGHPLAVSSLHAATLEGTDIIFGDHCYCCTAGEGSSCTGALAA